MAADCPFRGDAVADGSKGRSATARSEAVRTGSRFLIRDRDSKSGQAFSWIAVGTSIEVLKTPHRAPKANAICERFLGSVRRVCLDHTLVVGEQQLYRVIREYVANFNRARPHRGIEQKNSRGHYIRESRGTKRKDYCVSSTERTAP